ncbi:MAG: branched-chain amino acid ABC transporter permease [Pseudomonas sp.]
MTVIALLFNGVTFGMLLFLISCGLTVTLGVMRVINLAHGAFAMMGGYFTLYAMKTFELSFFPGILCGVLATMVAGYVMERTIYRWVFAASELGQVLMTIGLTFVLISLANLQFGGLLQRVTLPPYLSGNFEISGINLSIYRFFILIITAVVAVVMWLGLERTGFGRNLRAAVDNKPMAACVGINVGRLFSWTFSIGCGLAAVGGALGTEFLPIEPYYALKYLVLVLIVVSLGGLGSLKGSLLAAIMLGLIDAFTRFYLPSLGGFVMYLVVFVVLLARPQGLLGRA